VLKELKEDYPLNKSIVPACYEKIDELKQQLNELEDE
jgi:polyhydroxyalkanoate synthesis regulator phasin